MINKKIKAIAIFQAIIMLGQTLLPTVAYGLTEGPSQPETSGFKSIETSDLVNTFTGDFSYNIPLMDVGGYPINLAYNAGISPEQEASWVGLGWSLTPGAINRNLRGLPDDFNGDSILREQNYQDNWTVGIEASGGLELLGMKKPKKMTGNATIYYNSYKGMGISLGAGISKSVGSITKDKKTSSLGVRLNLSFDSQSGATISPAITFSKEDECLASGAALGGDINSRDGLRNLNFSASRDQNIIYALRKGGPDELHINGKSGGMDYSFFGSKYFVAQEMPTKSYNFSFKVTLGAEILPVNTNLAFRGFYSNYGLAYKRCSRAAYGYLNEQNEPAASPGLVDVVRENDGAYAAYVPNLPIPAHTYDLFSISGEGNSGQFRAFRGDVGVLHDPYVNSASTSGSVGLEFGVGNTAKFGGDAIVSLASSTTNRWTEGNDLDPDHRFQRQKIDNLFEPSYFKMSDEFANDEYSNSTAFNYYRDRVFRPHIERAIDGHRLNKSFDEFNLKNQYIHNIPSEKTKNLRREPRTTMINYVLNGERNLLGYNYQIQSFEPNSRLNAQNKIITTIPYQNTLSNTKPAHHIGSIEVLKPDGKKYVYGIPVYNLYQKDATFSVDRQANAASLISYTSAEASVNNPVVPDKYYNAVTTPAYAHSFLLTRVFSKDYVDITNNGPTADDYGDWVKFNYSKAPVNFKWRIPIAADKGINNEGYISKPVDNKASYSFGVRETWLVHSIESKDFIAFFTVSNERYDALGVAGEHGGVDANMKSYKLEKVSLFSKHALEKYGANATPIKEVYFNYDYSLCPNTDNANIGPNNENPGKGKLTLTSIHFKYANSTRGTYNKYEFSYNGAITAYNRESVDRWGTFRNNNLNGYPTTRYYPYTIQNPGISNGFAGVWNLNKIKLPTGGEINVEYEADTYAYVQDKRACEMFKIEKMGSDEFQYSNAGNQTYASINKPHNYLFISVPVPVTSKSDIDRLYLDKGRMLYMRCKTTLTAVSADFEYISCYAKILNFYTVAGHPNIICIKIEGVDLKGGTGNPVARTVFQLLREQFMEKVYPGSVSYKPDLVAMAKGLLNSFKEFSGFVKSYDRKAVERGYGKTFDPDKSFARLCSPNYSKIGGGHRVKSIMMSDNWTLLSENGGQSETTGKYITEYEYTTTIKENGVDKLISSGVASYEPAIGNDENPFRQPINYSAKSGGAFSTINHMFSEEPLGESYFPSPVVGYSVVKMNTVKPGTSSVSTGVGYEQYEYFTSKDFPTIATRSDVLPRPFKPKLINTFIKFISFDIMRVSQGYYIEVNNMHGQLKSKKVFNEIGALISGEEYFYKSKINDQGKRVLNNNIDILTEKAEILVGKERGVQREMVLDFRENTTEVFGGGIQVNSENFVLPLGIIPLFISIPPIFGLPTYEQTQFRSAVAVNVVAKAGIIDSVHIFKDGAYTTRKNLLFDGFTGVPLLTSTTDEYGDELYDFKYPSYWIYGDLDGAYKNHGYTFSSNGVTNGILNSSPAVISNLRSGDEVVPASPLDYIKILNYFQSQQIAFWGPLRYWYCHVEGTNVTTVDILIDARGKAVHIPIPVNFKVVNSGFRNRSSEFAGNISTYNENPFTAAVSPNNHLQYADLNSKNIISMNAVSYTHNWEMDAKNTVFPGIDCSTTTTWNCFGDFIKALIELNQGVKNMQTATPALLSQHNVFYSVPAQQLSVLDILSTVSNCNTPLIGGLPLDQVMFMPIQYNVSNYGPGESYVAIIGDDCYFTITKTYPSQSSFSLDDINPDALSSNIVPDGNGCYSISDREGRNTYKFCFFCLKCNEQCYTTELFGTSVNPYRYHVLGNWTPSSTYFWYGDRYYNNNSLSRASGRLLDPILPFEYISSTQKWKHNVPYLTQLNGNLSIPKWNYQSKVTKINKAGKELENQESTDIYSAALLGYKDQLPIAVSKNCNYHELFFTGYEDVNYNQNASNYCDFTQWYSDQINSLEGNDHIKLSTTEAHTGRYSLSVDPNNHATYVSQKINHYPRHGDGTDFINYHNNNHEYLLASETFLPQLNFEYNEKYSILVWVKKDIPCPEENYGDDILTLRLMNSNNQVIHTINNCMNPKSKIIDGWQLYEYILDPSELPFGNNYAFLEFNLNSGLVQTYFDDFRISPLKSSTTAFVYHDETLRLMAGLDQNNYATFYEYDDEGELIRTKKETERGIFTITETRKNVRIAQ